MSSIIATIDSSSKYDKCENTYFHFNGAILVLHYFEGNGGDEENPYMEYEWTIYHDALDGKKDLYIWWCNYESGHMRVHTVDYPEGFDIQGLRDLLEDEFGITMPTSRN
jgi:hypothetical protein